MSLRLIHHEHLAPCVNGSGVFRRLGSRGITVMHDELRSNSSLEAYLFGETYRSRKEAFSKTRVLHAYRKEATTLRRPVPSPLWYVEYTHITNSPESCVQATMNRVVGYGSCISCQTLSKMACMHKVLVHPQSYVQQSCSPNLISGYCRVLRRRACWCLQAQPVLHPICLARVDLY